MANSFDAGFASDPYPGRELPCGFVSTTSHCNRDPLPDTGLDEDCHRDGLLHPSMHYRSAPTWTSLQQWRSTRRTSTSWDNSFWYSGWACISIKQPFCAGRPTTRDEHDFDGDCCASAY